ncbi:hypothetical protein B738_08959 [Photorhabdus temperata subsp. temperata M1021]|nr:hypothetical protein B738_08959 [Photorhabdus temperata subsp. temperata M1021]
MTLGSKKLIVSCLGEHYDLGVSRGLLGSVNKDKDGPLEYWISLDRKKAGEELEVVLKKHIGKTLEIEFVFLNA